VSVHQPQEALVEAVAVVAAVAAVATPILVEAKDVQKC